MEAGKLFIGGISWETSEERLREYFQAFGEVVEAVIMKDRTTGRARGFGFVVFANASVAERVVRERHIIDGRTVEAKKAVPRDDHQNFTRNHSSSSIHGSPGPTRTKKIFVGGLASTVTENDFKMYFDQFGTITDVVVMYDHNTQRPRGFGFITYDSEEAVDKVLLKTFHELNGKTVEVKRAVPKELSPAPKLNHGLTLNRANSFLNAYNSPVHNSSFLNHGMKMEDRFSTVSVGRSGYPPYSPSNQPYSPSNQSMRYGLIHGGSGDFGLGFGNGSSPFFGGNSSESGSLLSNANRNMWGNGSLLSTSNDFLGSGGVIGGFGNGNAGVIGAGNGGYYGNRENNAVGRNGYFRNDGLYSMANNVGDESGFGKLYGGDSFYADHSWLSSSSRDNAAAAAANVTSNNSARYDGGYNSVTANRGIAA